MPSSVAFIGDLDLAGRDALRAALDCLQGPALVDLRNVKYIDSCALNEFVRLASRVGAGQVTLIVAPGNVRRILKLVCFERLFTIVDVVRPSFVRALGDLPAPGGTNLWAAAGAESDGG